MDKEISVSSVSSCSNPGAAATPTSNSRPAVAFSRSKPVKTRKEIHRSKRSTKSKFPFSVSCSNPHAGFFSPSFLIRETNVLGLMLSNSAAPPEP